MGTRGRVRGGSLTPPGALRFTCCHFVVYRSELLVLPGPTQGCLGLGLATRRDCKDASAPKSLPSQKNGSLGVGVKTQERTECAYC